MDLTGVFERCQRGRAHDFECFLHAVRDLITRGFAQLALAAAHDLGNGELLLRAECKQLGCVFEIHNLLSSLRFDDHDIVDVGIVFERFLNAFGEMTVRFDDRVSGVALGLAEQAHERNVYTPCR